MDELLLVDPQTPVLKGGTYHFPHQALTFVCGPSGAGKTTLVRDVLYQEGRRRCLELIEPALLPLLPPPSAPLEGELKGLALMQELSGQERGRARWVSSLCGMLPLLKQLFAHAACARCPHCGQEVHVWTPGRLVDDLLERAGGEEVWFWVPLVRQQEGTHALLLEKTRRQGFLRVRIDGVLVSLDEELPKLDRHQSHSIDLLLDVLEVRQEERSTILSTLEEARRWHADRLIASWEGKEAEWLWEAVCPGCDEPLPWVRENLFSADANLPLCPTCRGRYSGEGQNCARCEGLGLHPSLGFWSWRGHRFPDLLNMRGEELYPLFAEVQPAGAEEAPWVRRLLEQLSLLGALDLGHLRLAWWRRDLSPREVLRCRLAGLVAEQPVGMTLILDDPLQGTLAAGLGGFHQALDLLRSRGNTLIVTSVREDVLPKADWFLVLGRNAGDPEARIRYQGPAAGWSGQERVSLPETLCTPPDPVGRGRRFVKEGPEAWVHLGPLPEGALKGLCCSLPHNRLTVVRGPSGSGKSKLLSAFRDAFSSQIEAVRVENARFPGGPLLSGPVIYHAWNPFAGQSPISLLHYLGLDKLFAHLMASQPRALALGLAQESFLRQTREGRCPHCQGRGIAGRSAQGFCSHCRGSGINPRSLLIRFGSLRVCDYLEASFEEASASLDFLEPFARVSAWLERLGLSRLRLGQSLASLGQGERQRIRLLRAIREGFVRHDGLILLDEPAAGLSDQELEPVLLLWDDLLALGHTLLVVEEHPLVEKRASYRVLLGRNPDSPGFLLDQGFLD